MAFSLRAVSAVALLASLAACSSAPSSTRSTLASSQNPFDVVVNGNDVFWATFDGPMYLRSCPASGCAGAPNELASGSWFIERFAVDATSVYVVGADEPDGDPWIARCPRAGCAGAPERIADWGDVAPNEAFHEVTALAVDATNLYWATADGVRACPIAGCAGHVTTLASIPEQLGAVPSPGSIAVDGGVAYWADPSSRRVVSCAVTGCNGTPTVLVDGALVLKLALDGSRLSWLEGDGQPNATTWSVKTCDVTSCATTTTTLADAQANPVSIAVQDGVVFWANQGTSYDGAVLSCATSGCGGAPKKLGASPAPEGLAVGAGKVFWSDSMDGAVYAAPAGG